MVLRIAEHEYLIGQAKMWADFRKSQWKYTKQSEWIYVDQSLDAPEKVPNWHLLQPAAPSGGC